MMTQVIPVLQTMVKTARQSETVVLFSFSHTVYKCANVVKLLMSHGQIPGFYSFFLLLNYLFHAIKIK